MPFSLFKPMLTFLVAQENLRVNSNFQSQHNPAPHIGLPHQSIG